MSGVGRHKPLKLGRSGRFLSGTRTHMRVKKRAVITKTVRSNQSDTTKQHRRASSPVLARERRSSDTLSLWPLPQPTHCTTCSTSQSYLDSCTPAPKGQRSLFEDASVDILDQKDRWFERGGHVTYDGCRQPPTTHPEIFFQVGWRFHLSPPGHMIKQGFMLQYIHKSTPVKCQFAVFWVVFLRGRRPSSFWCESTGLNLNRWCFWRDPDVNFEGGGLTLCFQTAAARTYLGE